MYQDISSTILYMRLNRTSGAKGLAADQYLTREVYNPTTVLPDWQRWVVVYQLNPLATEYVMFSKVRVINLLI